MARKKNDISTKEFLAELREAVTKLGGTSLAAEVWGVYPQNVTNALSGAKLPVNGILNGMGLRHDKTIIYRYKRVK